MWYRKKADLSRGNVCSLCREAFHGAGDGSASTHFEMAPGNAPDSAPGPRVSNRWRPQRRGIKRTHGSKRSPASQRTDRARRPSDDTQRLAAPKAIQLSSRAVAIAVRLPSSVRHLARDRKIELLLAARLPSTAQWTVQRVHR